MPRAAGNGLTGMAKGFGWLMEHGDLVSTDDDEH